jgi:hypothetical protein
MIPQERGIEGLSIYFIFLFSIFFLMENRSYVSFLGEGQELLDSQEFINPFLVYWGDWSWFLILYSHSHSLSHYVFGFSTYSCIHSRTCSLFTPLMDISLHSFPHSFIFPHVCLGLGKGDEMMKCNHGIIGCRDYWCNPTMI